jgi:nitrite reductase/ring-hydroxylating ferredoxin subunit
MEKLVRLGSASDIPLGSVKTFEVGPDVIAVFHQADGFHAIDDRCPHQGGPLSEGFITNGRVACPWHQWEFCLKSGECETVPSLPVTSYQLEIKDEILYLKS